MLEARHLRADAEAYQREAHDLHDLSETREDATPLRAHT